MQNTLKAILGQTDGFKWGKPHRIDEKSLSVVLPLIRETTTKREYITFPETEKVLVFDTGQIDAMEAHNTTENNVFIRSGTIFTGKTQERALQRSALLFPGQKIKLGVRCVYAHKGINSKTETKYGGITPLNFDQQVYASGYTPSDQSTYWKAATHVNSVMNTLNETSKLSKSFGKKVATAAPHHLHTTSFSPMATNRAATYMANLTSGLEPSPDMAATEQEISHGGPTTWFDGSDLKSNFDNFAMNFDDVLSKIKREKNQAGLALITHKGVETIETFDHKESWKALHESAVKRLGSHVVDQGDENVFEYKPEHAVKQVHKVLSLDWKTNRIFEHRPSNGEPHVLISGLTAENYVGECVEVNEAVIHLVILRKAA